MSLVTAIFVFGSSEPSFYIWSAFVGAGATAIVVYFIASLGRGGITPLNLTIAGAAISTLLFSLRSAILILSTRHRKKGSEIKEDNFCRLIQSTKYAGKNLKYPD